MLLNFLFVATAQLAYWLFLILLGLPFTLACLPQHHRKLSLPLAPLAAIALLGIAYQYWFFWLLQPYRPIAVHSVIAAFSIASFVVAVLLRGQRLATIAQDLLNGLRWNGPLLAVVLVGTFIFSGYFAANGLKMLSAGEDELGYVEVTRHLIEHMFTRDGFDFPWPRADHYLGDYTGRGLSYFPSSRLGAFFLLADLSSISGLSLERSFPLLMGVLAAVGATALGALALLVRPARRWIPLVQVTFVTSWLLVMLHLQGSLSHMASLGFRLGGLAYILWAVAYARERASLILAAVFAAAWLVFYYESIGFGLALPLGGGLLAAGWRAVRGRPALLRRYGPRVVALLVLTGALQPQMFLIAINSHVGLAKENIVDLQDNTVAASIARVKASSATAFPAVLGFVSYYDQSEVNARIGLLLTPYAWLMMLGLTSLAALGLWLRLPAGVREAWTAIPLSLMAIAFVTAGRGNYLVLVRSAQMVMPHVWLGLTLLAFARRTTFGAVRWRLPLPGTRIVGRAATRLVWAVVLSLNIFSVVRTIVYVNNHSRATDAIVRRYDPDSSPWTSLRQLVGSDAPVLLSGFRETATTHMIALGLRDIPRLVGASISEFWFAIDPDRLPKDPGKIRTVFAQARHWLPLDQLLERYQAEQILDWKPTYARLLARSQFGIVPVSGPYPKEWGQWPSLFGLRSWRVPNLCDVLERGSPAFIVDAEPASAGADEFGSYWILDGVARARPLHYTTTVTVEVRYSGATPRIFLDGIDTSGAVRPISGGKLMALAVEIGARSPHLIEVRASSETRLRSIGLYDVLR